MRTDNELIKEFQEGKEAAFNELVDRYLSSTYGFFTKFTDSKEEAEDLAQDVFIKMYKALKKFRFESEFKTYLYRANINMSNTYLRRNKWKIYFIWTKFQNLNISIRPMKINGNVKSFGMRLRDFQKYNAWL